MTNTQKLTGAAATLAAGALLFIHSSTSQPAPSVRQVVLEWNYFGPTQNIVFLVRSTNRLIAAGRHWPVVAQLTARTLQLPATNAAAFFIISASNTVTQTESSFATK